MSELTHLTFDQLLDRFFADPGAEKELERRYATHAALVVVDFTAMVKRSDAEGIIYALALPRAAELAMEPAIKAHGGQIVKRVADTFFAVFRDPRQAIPAVWDALRLLDAFNAPRTGKVGDGSRNEPIHACVGVGYGPALVIPGQDLYGEEINRAFVLGEDVANAREVLVTEALVATMPELKVSPAPAERIKEAGFPFLIASE